MKYYIMIKIKNFIAQITSKTNLKWVLVFLVLWWLFVGNTYAATNQAMSWLDTISWVLNLILSLASWVWILLANLAGKLMTNDLVYWWFLHLDASLWTLRNVTKNFANFALWFFVLFAIVKNIFSGVLGKDGWDRSPISVIKKTLIAGVLIQMSWFLMAAVIDLSTIMTSAIWSFPSQFIASDTIFQWDVSNSIKQLDRWKIVFNTKDPANLVTWSGGSSLSDLDDDEFNKVLDTLMPNYDSVSGPLIFIGLSVFNFNDFETFSNGWWSDVTSIDKWWDLFTSLGLSAIVLISFSLMMFLIFVFNLFRVIMLWLIIPLMPIIVLLKVFGLTDKLKWWWKWLDLSKFMNIKNIMMLVFKPVLMVWTLSLILVILVMVKTVIAWNKVSTVQLGDTWNMTIESTAADGEWKLYNSTIKSEWIMEFSMNGVKDTIADIIVYFFGLFLIYFLVKMVVKTETGIWFIDKSVWWLFETFENLATNLPIIPIAWWVGIKALQEKDIGQAATRMAWIDTASQYANISAALGLWWSFKTLDTTVDKDTFISNAMSTASSMSLTTDQMLKNSDFDKKLREWNYKNDKSNQITNSDFYNITPKDTKTKEKSENPNNPE